MPAASKSHAETSALSCRELLAHRPAIVAGDFVTMPITVSAFPPDTFGIRGTRKQWRVFAAHVIDACNQSEAAARAAQC